MKSLLPERLQKIRKNNNMTQSELAKKLGFTKVAISQWELGKTEPSNEILLKIAKIFNTPVGYLLGETNTSNSDEEFRKRINKDYEEISKLNYSDLETVEQAKHFLNNNLFVPTTFFFSDFTDEQLIEYAQDLLKMIKSIYKKK